MDQTCKLIDQANFRCSSAISKLTALEKRFVEVFNNSCRVDKMNKSLPFSNRLMHFRLFYYIFQTM